MSIKKNILYSSVLTVSRYLLPLITYPYVSRVLGVTNIGICNFVDSIINYFLLVSMMGVVSVGVREIAASKSDAREMSKTFSSLVGLNGMLTLFSLLLLVAVTLCVPQLYAHKELMMVGALKLAANFCLLEWLYTGLENFRYITIRTLIVRAAYAVAVFVFIRDADDYPLYYLFLTLMIVVNAVVNTFYSRHFVSFSWRHLHLKQYLKPVMTLGVYAMLSSMYTTFNMAFLGFVASPDEVGFYGTAAKLFTIIIAFYTAFTTVMMPRMSALLSEQKTEEFRSMVRKATNVLIALAVPFIIICCVFSSGIVMLISGDGYEGAWLPTRIVMPLIFVIGYSQILVVQILMPMRGDRETLVNSAIGAGVGVLLNVLLVPHLHAVGSSITWVVSEVCVMSSAQYFVKKKTGIGFPFRSLLRNVAAYLPAIAVSLYIGFGSGMNGIVAFFAGSVFVVLYGLVIQTCFLRDELVLQYVGKVKDRFFLRR